MRHDTLNAIVGFSMFITGAVAGTISTVDIAVNRMGFLGLPTCRTQGNASLPDVGFPGDASERGISADANGTRVSYVWNGTEYEVYFGPGCQMSKLSTSPAPVK
ncbi:MAG: hypothetical protein WCV93_01525 [Candidatus Shapirobacteria bacterium]|jgi:hypothetical protein